MRKIFTNSFIIIVLGIQLLLCEVCVQKLQAQTFVHPGGLHTRADLDRVKAKVAAGEHPWIDGWNVFITGSGAKNTYNATPYTNIGGTGNRQQASRDAHAAYINTIRWYVTGDTTYAECAVRICNAWASKINVVANGELFQLPINNFMQAAELLRIYPGWAPADFAKFKAMALTYFYPACHNFLGDCHRPASWDAPALASIMGIAVLCDDRAMFDEAITYFKTGASTGNIMKGIWKDSGQFPEMGRDQPHAALGPASFAEICQTAWNQGVDLYSYSNNRLLAAYEYYCKFNLNHPIVWEPYNDCANDNFFYVSQNAAYRIRSSPVYEMIYNHYVVIKGLSAPYTKAMVNLARPEREGGDFFGNGTLLYTLNAAASPYPAYPAPPAPTALTATEFISRVHLKWTAPPGDVAQGYNILRSTTPGGPYTTIAWWNDNTATDYTDVTVTNGTTYYYVVSAINQSGVSSNSAEASAKPVEGGALPCGWIKRDIGSIATAGTAVYASAGNNTFIVSGSGAGIGGLADGGFSYTHGIVTGDFTITARLSAIGGTLSRTGLMMRESLDPNAKALMIKLGDLGWRIAGFGARATTGGNMRWVDGDRFTWAPVWFRLQRTGNTFTGSQSSDGVTWFTVGTSTVDMSSTYYAGLVACSASSTAGEINISTFDNVTTAGGGTTPPSAPTGLTATVVEAQVLLNWNAISDATSYTVKRATVSGGPYTTVATVDSINYTDAGLAAGKYYYVITAINFACEGQSSAEASVTLGSEAVTHAVKPMKLFSPDNRGDVTTETWTIENAHLLDGSEIIVYNRQGQKVYSSVGYSTPWDGTSNGAPLPDGAYFYIIRYPDHKKQTGSVTIARLK